MKKNNHLNQYSAIIIILLLMSINWIPFTIGRQEYLRNNAFSHEIFIKDLINNTKNKEGLHNEIDNAQCNNQYFYSFPSNDLRSPVEKTLGKRTTGYEKKELIDLIQIDNRGAQTTDNETHFHGQSNNSIFIVKVTSPNTIYLNDLTFQLDQGVIGKQTSTFEDVTVCYFTNLTFSGPLIAGAFTHGFFGSLRYKHIKLGPLINTTLDNRTVGTAQDELIYIDIMHDQDRILAPGTWYFVITSTIYDLRPQDQSTHISLWMNFSEACNNITISASEGGTIYGLWYGEYNANIVISKAFVSELILNAKTRFHINNTFLYLFFPFPWLSGYWNLRWRTPQGTMTYSELRTENKTYYGKHNKEGCLYGIGGPGNYLLRMESYDSSSDPGKLASMPYFIGLDVKLS